MLDWRTLVSLPDTLPAKYDVAAVNLACTEGLPGAERIDVPGCLRALDRWASVARRWVEARYETVFLRDPARFDHSEVVFRAVGLVAVLTQTGGVRYNPAKKAGVPLDAQYDLDDQFVHGAIQGPGGTCATLPVLLAALGRRLGYPIRLATTAAHLFCRWDDPRTGERVNLEWKDEGLNSHPDDYYRTWPVRLPPVVEAACGHLRSLTPR